jgi:hypothetical protein
VEGWPLRAEVPDSELAGVRAELAQALEAVQEQVEAELPPA